MMFTLPWPSSTLSPNRRAHWAVLAKARKTARRQAYMAVLSQLATSGVPKPRAPAGPLAVHLLFVAPDRRPYDRDNLLARMKAALDGVADALGYDDSRVAHFSVRQAEKVERPGYVLVQVGPDDGAALMQ